MANLDYNRIITHKEFKTISENDKNYLITIANIEMNKYKQKNSIFSTLGFRNEQAIEIINNGVYKNFNDLEKEIIKTFIVLETEEIIKLLIKSNILYEHLEGLINNLSKIKKTSSKDKSILQNKDVTKILSVLEKIIFIIKFQTQSQDDYLIINKLSYIVAFEKEIYLKLQQEKVKKPQ